MSLVHVEGPCDPQTLSSMSTPHDRCPRSSVARGKRVSAEKKSLALEQTATERRKARTAPSKRREEAEEARARADEAEKRARIAEKEEALAHAVALVLTNGSRKAAIAKVERERNMVGQIVPNTVTKRAAVVRTALKKRGAM